MFVRLIRLVLLWTLVLPLLGPRPTVAWAATAPLPPEASALSEDERWLLWQQQQPPQPQPSAGWQLRESEHFRFHVAPGSAAARDLPAIVVEAEASLQRVLARLAMEYQGQLDVYLVERVFWQGGAAYGGEQLLITYGDRNYVDVPLLFYLDHELTHAIADGLIPEAGGTNSLLAEGLAVWATGGHYGPEPIHAMAAALPAMGQYVPIERLLADFHAEQHEIAYIQAASFVGWLEAEYGLAQVKRFYGHAADPDRFFAADYATLEARWLAWLAETWGAASAESGLWWQAQIRFFDTMRAYETARDPFARVLPSLPSAWPLAEQRRYATNLDGPDNLALESQLAAASQALDCRRDPSATNALLDEVAAMLRDGRAPPGSVLAARLALATRLAAQDAALQQRRPALWLDGVAAEAHAPFWQAWQALARRGPIRQELVWLDVQGNEATALVAWHPLRGGPARAWRLTLHHSEGAWQLAALSALPNDDLIPRNQRRCTP